MAITAQYIVRDANVTHGSFIDLGIQGRELSDNYRSVAYVGGAGTLERVYLRAGINLDFASSVGTGTRVVYLDGRFSDYQVDAAAAGQLVLSRNATGEVLIVKIDADTTLAFADGSLTTEQLSSQGADATLDPAGASGLLTGADIADASQTLRVVTFDATGETHAIARQGTQFIAQGGAGVDSVYVEAGATVDATKLGAGEDKVYFTRNWADYSKTVLGLKVVFTHPSGERVEVTASQGANDDRLIFADGAVMAAAARNVLKDNPSAALADVPGADTQLVTKIYTPEMVGSLSLAADTGTATDDSVTSNGALNFSRAAGDVGDTWEYRLKNEDGTFSDWQTVNVANDGFAVMLQAQASGAKGRTYEIGDIEVRQVSAAGVQGAVRASTEKYVIDNATDDLALQVVPHTALRITSEASASDASRAVIDAFSSAAQAYTLQAWIDFAAAPSAGQAQGIFGNEGTGAERAWLYINDAGNLAVQMGGETAVEVQAQGNPVSAAGLLGWQHLALIVDGTSVSVYLNGELAGTATAEAATTLGAHAINLGNLSSTELGSLNAAMRDVQIWDSARTEAQVKADMHTPSLGDANLKAYFPLSETEAPASNLVSGGPNIALQGTSALGDVRPETGYQGAKLQLIGGDFTFAGSNAEEGATLSFTADDGTGAVALEGTVTVQADGSWSFIATNFTPVGGKIYTIEGIQTDLAGNVSQLPVKLAATFLPDVPGLPDLAEVDDSGFSSTDNITRELQPTVSGTFTPGASAFTLVLNVNGVETLYSANGVAGLTVDLVAGTWSYTPESAYAHDDIVKVNARATVNGVERTSPTLTITLDAVAEDATVVVPALVQDSSFDAEGNLVITGTMEADSTRLKLTLSDSDAQTPDIILDTDESGSALTFDAEAGTWSLTLSKAQLAALAEGTLTLDMQVTDRAGNTGTFADVQNVVLELVNGAPELNADVTVSIDQQIELTATGLLLDLTDIDGEALFTDADADGSDNATLTYSAELLDFGADGKPGGDDDSVAALPQWLQLTSTGQLQIVDGETPVGGVYVLRLKATDGAGASVSKNMTLTVGGPELSLDPAHADIMDVRSDISLTASQALAGLVDKADATGLTITLVNTADADRNIVLDLTNDAHRAMVTVDGTSIRINPSIDLDIATTYRIEASGGAFVTAEGAGSVAIKASDAVTLTTVEPSATDTANSAKFLEADGTWSDVLWFGLDGRGTMGRDPDWNQESRAADFLSGAAGKTVFYAGNIGVQDGTFNAKGDFWAKIEDFGLDDLIYFDDTRVDAAYGNASVIDSVGLSTVEDLDADLATVDGNSFFVSPAQPYTTGGVMIDVAFDDAVKTLINGTYFESWNDAAFQPDFASKFGALPVVVA